MHLWAPGYNVFADLGTLPVLLSAYALCMVLERACLAAGKGFGVWEIDESVVRLEGQEEGVDLAGLFRQLEAPARQRELAAAAATPGHVKFHASQWRVVEQARAEEDALKYELASDRVAAQTFRDMFLTYNKPWLQGQLHEVFTPRTLFLYRKEIIEQFRAVMDELAPDVSLSDDEKPEGDSGPDAGASAPSTSSVGGKSKRSRTKGGRRQRPGAPPIAGVGPGGRPVAEEQALLHSRLTPSTAAIARYWLTRMRFVATLRVQVQAIVDLHIEDECLYCGATAGLAGELLQDIEELFHDFLRDTGESKNLPNYKFQRWIRYFKGHAQFRTLCVECAELVQDYNRKVKRRARRKALAHDHGHSGTAPGLSHWNTQARPERTSRPSTAAPERAEPTPALALTPAPPPARAPAPAPTAPSSAAQEARLRQARIRSLGPGPRAVISHWINLMRASQRARQGLESLT